MNGIEASHASCRQVDSCRFDDIHVEYMVVRFGAWRRLRVRM